MSNKYKRYIAQILGYKRTSSLYQKQNKLKIPGKFKTEATDAQTLYYNYLCLAR